MRPKTDLEDATEASYLLRDCVVVLRALLRHTRGELTSAQRRALRTMPRHFAQPASTLTRGPKPQPTESIAWTLTAMHWGGFSHPAALLARPLHPPTGLVRWLSRFTVYEQVLRPRQIQRELAGEVWRTWRRAQAVARTMRSRQARVGTPIVLSPALLQ